MHAAEHDVEETLRIICKTLITFLLSRFGQDMFRVCVAEAQRFPELGRTFYDSGPKRWGRKIAQYLDSPGARLVLDIDDTNLAADQLAQLCRTDLMLKVLFGIERIRPRPRSTASPTRPSRPSSPASVATTPDAPFPSSWQKTPARSAPVAGERLPKGARARDTPGSTPKAAKPEAQSSRRTRSWLPGPRFTSSVFRLSTRSDSFRLP
jgi:hypothetical protein